MELVCELKPVDLLRLCSAMFETLVEIGYPSVVLRSVNYVQQNTECSRKFVEVDDENFTNFQILARPCRIHDEERPKLFVLADSREPGSIFLFLTTTNPQVLKTDNKY